MRFVSREDVLLVRVRPDWLVIQPYDSTIDKVAVQQPRSWSTLIVAPANNNGTGAPGNSCK